jgi:hypothetical protein
MAGLISGCVPADDTVTADLAKITEEITNINNQITTIDNSVQNIDNSVTNIDNRVTEIDNRVGKVEDRLAAAGAGALNYQVRYVFEPDTFAPIDPNEVRPEQRDEALKERAARVRFFKELTAYLDTKEREGFQLEYIKDSRAVPNVPNFIRHIALTNAIALSGGKRHEEHISDAIARIAIEVGDPDLAVPVRRDPTTAPLAVQQLTLTHNATTGVADVMTVTKMNCQQVTTFTVEGIPGDAEAWVYDQENRLRPFRDSFDFPHECDETIEEALKGRDPRAYVMVVSSTRERAVAQYRFIHMITRVEDQMPVPLTERAPACPPLGDFAGPNVYPDAVREFKVKVPKCA